MKGTPKQSVKGLRDIGTVRTVVQKQQKLERSHMVGRFARLDAEKTRLEREIDMWSTRKTTAEVKLAAVIEQIDVIRPILFDDPLRPKSRPNRNGKTLSKVISPNKTQYNSVSLNY